MSDVTTTPVAPAVAPTPTVPAVTATTGTPTTLSSLTTTLDPVALVDHFVKALENNSSPSVLASYIGEGVAAVGLVVGAFDKPLGLSISSVPQAVILGASSALALGMGIYRMVFDHKKKAVAAALATTVINKTAGPAKVA